MTARVGSGKDRRSGPAEARDLRSPLGGAPGARRARAAAAHGAARDRDVPAVPPGHPDVQPDSGGVPGKRDPAGVVVKAADVSAPEVQAIGQLEWRALASGQMHEPITIDVNDSGRLRPSPSPSTARAWTQPRRPRSRRSGTRSSRRPSARFRTPRWSHRDDRAVEGLQRQARVGRSLVFGFVLLLAFLLMLFAFRSLVIAFKAIVLNLSRSPPPTG